MKEPEDHRAALKFRDNPDLHDLETLDRTSEQFIFEQGLYSQFLSRPDKLIEIRIPKQEAYRHAAVLGYEQVFSFEKPAERPEQLVIFIVIAVKIERVIGKTLIIEPGVDIDFFAETGEICFAETESVSWCAQGFYLPVA